MAKPLLIAVTMLLWAPGSSLAATVRPSFLDRGTGVEFRAAPGETNHLRVWTDGDEVTFTDTHNRVIERAAKRRRFDVGRCEQVNVHTVRCRFDHLGVPSVRLGDRNDRVKVTGTGALVDGGRGDDVLIGTGGLNGGAGNDRLRGGPGDDGLTGGPGRDVVYGGGGDDSLSDGEADSQAAVDFFDGRSQRRSGDAGDTLNYKRRRGDLRIDLAAGTWSTEGRGLSGWKASSAAQATMCWSATRERTGSAAERVTTWSPAATALTTSRGSRQRRDLRRQRQ